MSEAINVSISEIIEPDDIILGEGNNKTSKKENQKNKNVEENFHLLKISKRK